MTQRHSAPATGAFSRFIAKVSGTGPWWMKTLRWLVTLSVVGVVVGAIAFFLLYQLIDIPDPNTDFQTQTTKVYYSDGKHVLGTFAMQDRESVSIDEVPAVMKAAVIAAEDRTFYTNRGIDIKGIIRAARNNATTDTTQGASTITQQYVKLLYLSPDRSYTRKIKEAILSIKIHNQLSKKEILEGYLNTIYFGNGAYGVQVAAKTYFDKPVSELSYPQAAVLAAVINSPSYYDPYSENGPEHLIPRYNYVLDGMQKSGAITAEQEAKFHDKLPKLAKQKDYNRFGGTKGYLLKLVERKMKALKFSDSEIQGGGLRIVTTFDYQGQKAAVDAVQKVRPDGLKELHTALVSVEPGTGAVRAMYGGKNYLKSQINWAIAGVQPGSTFKAFAIVAALEDGFGLKSQLNGSSPLRVGPQNTPIENQGDSGGESFGRVPLEYAAQKSINTAFVDLTRQLAGGNDEDISIGTAKIREAAKEAGIPESVLAKFDPNAYVTALGYVPVPAVDMANAYATLAADGKRADWYVIEKVTDSNGAVLHEHKTQTEQTIDEDVAADTIAAMQKVVNSGRAGTGSNGRTICPTAGKTGTATAGADDNQHVSSSWFAGYTPKLATAVAYSRGVGNENLEGYLNPFFGGTYPAMTFKAYMDAALKGSDCGTFPPPANLKADKGTIYKPPPPKCDDDEELNDSKTKCVPKPEPTPTPTPSPTPTACPPGSEGTPPFCTPIEKTCDADPLTPEPTCPPTDGGTGGGTGGGVGSPNNGAAAGLPLILLALARRRRRDHRARPRPLTAA